MDEMKSHTRTLVVAALAGSAIVCAHRAADAGDVRAARTPARCSIRYIGRGEFLTDELVVLASPSPDSEWAPGGHASAPGPTANTPRYGERHAWRFQISDVPPFVAQRHRTMLERAHGSIWVIPWFRATDCSFESGWLSRRENHQMHAVLFLAPRPESLWVHGEPTFNVIDEQGGYPIFERDSSGASPTSVRDLQIFLAVYPRLAGVTPWREGSEAAWAAVHRDSANSMVLHGRFLKPASDRMRDSLNRAGFPLSGDWRGKGALANGDSMHFWMRLSAEPRRFEWPATVGGEAMGWLRYYSGPAPFDSIPLPTRYTVHAGFAPTRQGLPSDSNEMRESIYLPFTSPGVVTENASWSWLARFAPASRRAAFFRADSILHFRIKMPADYVWAFPVQSIRLNAARDTMFAEFVVVDTVVARWTAHRTP